VSIVVVNYNTRDVTLECLRSIFDTAPVDCFEVIVVDNASEDGSAKVFSEQFPEAQLITRDQNIGFAQANNLAARRAKGEYLLLLNPDTVSLEGSIERLLSFARANPDAGIYGGRTQFSDGSLNPTSCWRRITLWSVFCQASGLSAAFRGSQWLNPEAMGKWQRDEVREVDIVTGCFLLIRRSLWRQLDGFDESFFVYGEEADLCLRAIALGAKPLVCPEAVVIHHGGVSERVRSAKMVRLFQAKALLMRKHWAPWMARLGVSTLDLWALTRLWAWSVMRRFGRPGAKDAVNTWSEVWHDRNSWRNINLIPTRAPNNIDQDR